MTLLFPATSRMAMLALAAAALGLAGAAASHAGPFKVTGVEAGPVVKVPAPATDEAATGANETAIFAGGCFWGIQGVFQHVAGVESAISGYAGGTLKDPTYQAVTTETTGHAESVEVTFDPQKVTYGQLLQVFFSVAHDPTQLNRQGYDVGPSYRSALFTMNDEQTRVAKAYIAELDAAKVFPAKIVTEVTPYTNFYRAEDYHQDATTTISINPGYIINNDLPKIEALKATFPALWSEKARLVFAENGA